MIRLDSVRVSGAQPAIVTYVPGEVVCPFPPPFNEVPGHLQRNDS